MKTKIELFRIIKKTKPTTIWFNKRRLAPIILTFLLVACYPNSRKSALKSFTNKIESKTWCEIKSKNKFIFKEGFLKQIINDKAIEIGKYKLDVRPNSGNWYYAIRTMEISINNKTYLLEFDDPSLEEKILILKNRKNKEYLFFSDNCELTATGSFAYELLMEKKLERIPLD